MNRKETRGLRFVLLVYFASRAFYLIAGLFFAAFLPISRFQRITADVPFGTLNIWAHWDGEHYMRLARSGYLNEPDNVSPAFFPLYSLLIRSFAGLFGGPISAGALTLWGVIISLLALPFALYFVYQIADHGWGDRVAKGAVLTLAFFPTAFFLNAAYTESLFLALSAGALWAAMVRKNLLLACVLAGFATGTRNVGIFLLVPLAYEWLRNAGYFRWRVVYLALAPSGLLLYMAYLWWRFGEPLLFYTEQKGWNREATGPLSTLGLAFERSREGLSWILEPETRSGLSVKQLLNHLDRADSAYGLALLVVAAALLVVGLRVLPLGLSAYAFLVAIVPAFFGTPADPLMGLPRYLIVAFPLFIVLGVLLKKRWMLAGWLLASAAVSLVFCALFITWRYVA
ncbi:MAG: mannosyltransferase family protein [Rubrobacteraceae bacterium]